MSEEARKIAEIEIIKKDLEQIHTFLPKLDRAIEKISEMSTSVSKMLAVHEEKISNHDIRISNIVEQNTRKDLHDRELRESFNRRLEVISQENKSERKENHKEIIEALNSLKKDLYKKIENEKIDTNKEIIEMKTRLTTLEKWKWGTMGTTVVIVFLISKILPYIITFLTAN